MKKIKIIADSTCDLPKNLLEKYEIDLFPLHVHLGDNHYLDGVDITPDQIYFWSNQTKQSPKTSALSPYEAQLYLINALRKAEDILCFTISEKMSSCCSVMYTTATEMDALDRVHIIDSGNLSSGIALQILAAADMIKEGMSFQEILNRLEELKTKVNSSFVVDSLTYLHRGGRCSGVASLTGNTLKIHPKIYVKENEMHVGKFYRGSLQRSLQHYVEDLKPLLSSAEKERVFITHSGMDEDLVELVRKEVEDLHYFNEVIVNRAGSIISSHCGPNTLGVLFIERK